MKYYDPEALKKFPLNVQKSMQALHSLPDCKARARSAGLRPCGLKAMTNGTGVCYFHGGASSTLRHKKYTNESRAKRAVENKRIRELRQSLHGLESILKDK
jgi:hypothetical protein